MSNYTPLFIDLDDIKSQLQVVDEISNDELNRLGAAAEQHVLTLLNMSALELVDTYGSPIPADLFQCIRCVCGTMAKYREDVTPDAVNTPGVMRVINRYRKIVE